MQVVEITGTSGQTNGENCQASHRKGGRCRLQLAGVCSSAAFGVCIVIAANHDQGGRVCLLQRFGHGCQVASVKRHRNGAARGLVQACGRGVAFSHQQHRSAHRIAAPVPQPRLAAAFLKKLVGAVERFLRGNGLDVPQMARSIAQRNQQHAIRRKPHAVALNAFSVKVATLPGVAGSVPLCKGFITCGRVA